jgi:hypothetical protein
VRSPLVDALGRIAHEEAVARLASRDARDDRRAEILGHAGIDRALEHHDRQPLRQGLRGLERRADDLAGGLDRAQIGLVVLVDRRRHGDDVDVLVSQLGRIGAVMDLRRLQRVALDLAGVIPALAQQLDAARLDVEADDGARPTALLALAAVERHHQRQADISQTDDGHSLARRGLAAADRRSQPSADARRRRIEAHEGAAPGIKAAPSFP